MTLLLRQPVLGSQIVGMTHIHVSERRAKRRFDGSVLLEQEIS